LENGEDVRAAERIMARLNPFVCVLVNEARRWRLSYSQFSESLGPQVGPQPVAALQFPLARCYEAIDSTQNVTHQIMLRLLFYMAIS
jgi:hypothetical protein